MAKLCPFRKKVSYSYFDCREGGTASIQTQNTIENFEQCLEDCMAYMKNGCALIKKRTTANKESDK
jgi:hypothetical protein